MIATIVIGVMLLCFVGVIVGRVYIGKWSDEAMDRIMEMEEEKRKFDN
jgi:ABC-type dipeptide/oligopeptide/nickel transport system permease subunit